MAILNILHKDGTRRIVRLTDKVFYSQSTNNRLDDNQFNKRMRVSAQGLAGENYHSHKIFR